MNELGLIAHYDFSSRNIVRNKVLNLAPDNVSNGFNAMQYDGYSLIQYKNWSQTGKSVISPPLHGIYFPQSTILQAITLNKWSLGIVSKMKGSNGSGQFCMSSGGSLWYGINTIFFRGSNNVFYTFTGTYNFIGIKTNFLFVADGLKIICYINGILTGSVTPVSTNMNYIQGFGDPNLSQPYRQFSGEIFDAIYFNRVLSYQEIKDYHNSFASKPYFIENFSNYPVGTFLNKGNWKLKQGLFSIGEVLKNDDVLPSIKKGTKYLTDISGGYIGIPVNFTYGTLEFDWNQTILYTGIGLGNKVLQPDQYTDNYCMYPYTNGQIQFQRGSVSLPNADNSYVAGTWYRTKWTRDVNNKWTIYQKGGAYGNNYKQICTFTDATYTKLTYFLFYGRGVSCKIANIIIYPNIIV